MAKQDYIVNHGGLMLMVEGKMTEVKRGQKIKLEAKQAEKMLKRKFLTNPSEAEAVDIDSSVDEGKKTSK